jgi:hypothetical protein
MNGKSSLHVYTMRGNRVYWTELRAFQLSCWAMEHVIQQQLVGLCEMQLV